MNKKKRNLLIACSAFVLAIVIASAAYVSDYYHADETAEAALASDEADIEIKEESGVLWFVPEHPTAGIIFYPGGKVEYTAYAPLMRECTRKSILCALVQMPGNLAVLDSNAADGLQERYPEITSWYMAGHSLGGSMAASYIADNADDFDGLILLAAYSTKDISDTSLKVLSIYGSEDGVLNRDSYEENRSNLPADTTELVIEGGCHAQFGSYGAQDGDGTPSISGEEQIRQTVDAIMQFVPCRMATHIKYQDQYQYIG